MPRNMRGHVLYTQDGRGRDGTILRYDSFHQMSLKKGFVSPPAAAVLFFSLFSKVCVHEDLSQANPQGKMILFKVNKTQQGVVGRPMTLRVYGCM